MNNKLFVLILVSALVAIAVLARSRGLLRGRSPHADSPAATGTQAPAATASVKPGCGSNCR
jgi:hypothetical protein